ncbi:unnamed protein product [Musa acuminata subsp. malaccensis]|uniref:(wild Malaysian banana) hypothetical protein n=1 Tax=Musa acuminata subsp. malaccensis TaxID=214687 RepID=A0A804L102_MUSAM|nr:unnamed protein product [Musa acuminata subsp. malaccensis]
MEGAQCAVSEIFMIHVCMTLFPSSSFQGIAGEKGRPMAWQSDVDERLLHSGIYTGVDICQGYSHVIVDKVKYTITKERSKVCTMRSPS